MTTKREWRERYKAEHRGASELETALILAFQKITLMIGRLDRAERERADWKHRAEDAARRIASDLDAAIAQRDLARDAAAALEGENARLDALLRRYVRLLRHVADSTERRIEQIDQPEPTRPSITIHPTGASTPSLTFANLFGSANRQPWPNVGGARLDQPDLGGGFVNGGES